MKIAFEWNKFYTTVFNVLLRFDIKWIRNVVLRNYENIDKDLSLGMKEKKYLKALHKRSKKGQLSKRPTISDYRVLVQAYGE